MRLPARAQILACAAADYSAALHGPQEIAVGPLTYCITRDSENDPASFAIMIAPPYSDDRNADIASKGSPALEKEFAEFVSTRKIEI
ncbi:hypothetical protein [Bradyrhizobium elkanii]|uniref:hypothetical protein n=1 Tax=Bradyrhizobium elkanii TaxID=29448 RepID=UPI0021699743|nr:hypothetical protein [Bradyrhizobium elkanii]MCS3520228.1 hypothetical protein [Bradyrhizobium elkanii]MCS4067883.1 hypothetical protein [Bradyrhizobium elkanii]MCS4083419.1 hypothetical protein [Bradyrhizobium elkanii]MCW2126954.1 hypothetical protein [Bradyrhizobium elkanii]MCW2173701.1 hypothetical protein [Bradyrhizobium elkanii]